MHICYPVQSSVDQGCHAFNKYSLVRIWVASLLKSTVWSRAELSICLQVQSGLGRVASLFTSSIRSRSGLPVYLQVNKYNLV